MTNTTNIAKSWSELAQEYMIGVEEAYNDMLSASIENWKAYLNRASTFINTNLNKDQFIEFKNIIIHNTSDWPDPVIDWTFDKFKLVFDDDKHGKDTFFIIAINLYFICGPFGPFKLYTYPSHNELINFSDESVKKSKQILKSELNSGKTFLYDMDQDQKHILMSLVD